MVTRLEINCNNETRKRSIMRSLKKLRKAKDKTNGEIIEEALVFYHNMNTGHVIESDKDVRV